MKIFRRPNAVEQAPQTIDDDQLLVDTMVASAARRSPNSPRRLDSESRSRTFRGKMHGYPLATKEKYSGNYEEGLTHLIMVGSTMLGISRGVNNKIRGSGRDPIEKIRVMVLPVGNHPAAEKHSAVTLLEVDPAKLKMPRQDGVIQDWEELIIGRDMLRQATDKEDPFVSSMHAKITIGSDGMISIEDRSSNGTQVLDEFDVQHTPEQGGLDAQGKAELASLMERFQHNYWEWTEDTAGVTVIANAQG